MWAKGRDEDCIDWCKDNEEMGGEVDMMDGKVAKMYPIDDKNGDE